MDNILEYIKKYGDLDFNTKAFNGVDSLVLSQLAYSDLKIMSDLKAAPFTIEDLGHDEDLARRMASITWLPNEDYKLIKSMSQSKRYKDLVINDFYQSKDYSKEGQFTAFTLAIKQGERVLVFRGTDASFEGWAESLALSFDNDLPAQISAKKYLEMIADKYDEDILMTGHSKGGNLIVYAASLVDKSIQDRIKKIYNLDGPGFLPEFYQREDYSSIEEKILVFMPKRSFVGMLLLGLGQQHVIECKGIFLDQHSPFNWMTEDGIFKELESLEAISTITNKAMDKWLQKIDKKDRKEIIKLLFKVLGQTGASDFNEILHSKIDNFFKIRQALNNLNEDNQNFLKQSVDDFISILKQEAFNSILG
ncbi:MAG: DUF2974 domain-containing protein [Tissierellia bacterium]|nr:DUF2974 domain-containing protein [Tissierellia bacterium]